MRFIEGVEWTNIDFIDFLYIETILNENLGYLDFYLDDCNL